MRFSLATLLLLLASGAVVAPAAQPADSLQTGDLGAEVVVTASRLLDEARQTGRHTTVITAAEIARSPARSLADVLRYAAGVETAPRGEAQADLTIRGSTFNGVLVLVDGARFNDPMTGHFLSDFPVPLAEIGRVEVLRGPAAAVYGPDALGGVVHVITKTALAEVAWRSGRTRQRPSGSAALSAGSAGTVGGAFAVRGGDRTGRWSAAYEGLEIGGEAIRDASGEPIVGSEGELRTDLSRHALTLATVLVPAQNTRLDIRIAGDTREFGAFQYYTPFASDSAREATSTAWAQAALSSTTRSGTAVRLRAAGRLHRDRYTYFPGLTPNTHVTARGRLSGEVSRTRGTLTLSAGASGEARGIDSNNQGQHTDLAAGAYVLARWAAAPTLTLTASGRIDADPGFGVEPTPAVALAWQAAPALTVRGAAGRAVRAPTYVERYFNTEAPRPGGNLGNPDLRAERAWNAEGGLDLYPAPGLALRATGFWRRTEDLIDFAQLSPEAEVFLAQNVLAARAAGAEVHASLRRTLAPGATLRAEAAYAYTDVALSGERPGAVYKYALGHAPHLAQARVSVASGGLTLGVDGLYKTRLADLPAVAVADVRASFALPGRGARIALTGEVRNVGDREYAEVFGAPMPGRTWHLGVRLARP